MQFRRDIQENKMSNFVKLKDKESVVGVFMGDPLHFYSVWENNRTKEVPEGTPGASFKFKINFFVKDSAGFTAKIFQGGVKLYNQLIELHDEWDLEKTWIKITRQGTGTETEYLLTPSKKEVTKEELKYLKSMELLPLEAKPKANGEFQMQHSENDGDDTHIPF